MARSRRYSSTSVDDVDGREKRISYITERAALRPVNKNENPDDWPCYVLEDATIYSKDGTHGNLLDAELEGSFVVRGRLIVDADLRNRLISKKMNEQYIELPDCQGFSIGSGPVTLWAMGQSGWIEIKPSERYQQMYSTMAEAISIYYFITDLHERAEPKKGSKTSLTIDNVLLKFAIADGTGLVRSEAAEKLKRHSVFLMSQMRKEGSINWKSTAFFKWLTGECQDVYRKLLKRVDEPAAVQSRIPLEALGTPPPLLVLPPPEQKVQTKVITTNNTRQSRSTPTIIVEPEVGSNSISVAAPNDLLQSGEIVPVILQLMRAADADESSPRERQTLSKIGNLLYNKYTLKSAALSIEIIKVHAKALLSSLGSRWKVAPIHAQLVEAATHPTKKTDELRMQALAVDNATRRRLAASFRKQPTGGIGYGRQRARGNEDAPTPEPSGKTLFPPLSGRRSGKEAGLRLASSPAVKHDGSSDDDSSRPRKRRRPSSPEMGDDESEVGTPPPITDGEAQKISFREDATPIAHKDVILTILSTPLPTLSPSGPNGTWTCDEVTCSFVVRDPQSEEGEEAIQNHCNEHAERLRREELVRKEAAGRRLPIDHLLDKLRKLGEEARLCESAREIIGGREVPMPIKRVRSMVV